MMVKKTRGVEQRVERTNHGEEDAEGGVPYGVQALDGD